MPIGELEIMTEKTRAGKRSGRLPPKQRIVGLLVKAAEAQDDLAATYRKMKWDCAADTAESEALEFRRRAESFKAKQPNAGPSDCPNAASCEARGSAAIRREYTLVQKAMKRAQQLNHANLYGAMQALAWVLRDHAMSPAKAFAEVEGR